MKQALQFVALLALASAISVFAVTWTMYSSPFSFPGVGVKQTTLTPVPPAFLHCQPLTKGNVLFQYRLPSSASVAKLSIYSISGACVKSFDLKSCRGSIVWNNGPARVAPGVYVGFLNSATGQQKVTFSVVQ